MDESIVIIKHPVGRPRIRPDTGVKLKPQLAWLTMEQYEYFRSMGDGTFAAGVRNVANLMLSRKRKKKERPETWNNKAISR